MKLLLVLILCLQLGLPWAQQEVKPGKCNPDVEALVVKGFEIERYLGLWYEIFRINNRFQRGGECSLAYYRANSDGSVRVENSQVNDKDHSRYTEIGRSIFAYPEQDPLPAIFNVSFPDFPDLHPNYKVLATDYSSYSLVWNCFQLTPLAKVEYLWFLSRLETVKETPAPVQEIMDKYFSNYQIHYDKQGAYCLGT